METRESQFELTVLDTNAFELSGVFRGWVRINRKFEWTSFYCICFIASISHLVILTKKKGILGKQGGILYEMQHISGFLCFQWYASNNFSISLSAIDCLYVPAPLLQHPFIVLYFTTICNSIECMLLAAALPVHWCRCHLYSCIPPCGKCTSRYEMWFAKWWWQAHLCGLCFF